MKWILIAGAAYLGYRILEERRPLPPVQDDLSVQGLSVQGLSVQGSLSGTSPTPTDVYPTHNRVPFEDLNRETCNIMLRAFADDYTAPRMIQEGYEKALKAANSVGAPIAWTQYIVSKNPKEPYESIAHRSILALRTADIYVLSGGRDLDEMRRYAIQSAMNGIS